MRCFAPHIRPLAHGRGPIALEPDFDDRSPMVASRVHDAADSTRVRLVFGRAHIHMRSGYYLSASWRRPSARTDTATPKKHRAPTHPSPKYSCYVPLYYVPDVGAA